MVLTKTCYLIDSSQVVPLHRRAGTESHFSANGWTSFYFKSHQQYAAEIFCTHVRETAKSSTYECINICPFLNAPSVALM